MSYPIGQYFNNMGRGGCASNGFVPQAEARRSNEFLGRQETQGMPRDQRNGGGPTYPCINLHFDQTSFNFYLVNPGTYELNLNGYPMSVAAQQTTPTRTSHGANGGTAGISAHYFTAPPPREFGQRNTSINSLSSSISSVNTLRNPFSTFYEPYSHAYQQQLVGTEPTSPQIPGLPPPLLPNVATGGIIGPSQLGASSAFQHYRVQKQDDSFTRSPPSNQNRLTLSISDGDGNDSDITNPSERGYGCPMHLP